VPGARAKCTATDNREDKKLRTTAPLTLLSAEIFGAFAILAVTASSHAEDIRCDLYDQSYGVLIQVEGEHAYWWGCSPDEIAPQHRIMHCTGTSMELTANRHEKVLELRAPNNDLAYRFMGTKIVFSSYPHGKMKCDFTGKDLLGPPTKDAVEKHDRQLEMATKRQTDAEDTKGMIDAQKFTCAQLAKYISGRCRGYISMV
jgi:hypothetical protein